MDEEELTGSVVITVGLGAEGLGEGVPVELEPVVGDRICAGRLAAEDETGKRRRVDGRA